MGPRCGPRDVDMVWTHRESAPLSCRCLRLRSLKKVVPLAGLEPARPCGQQILSLNWWRSSGWIGFRRSG